VRDGAQRVARIVEQKDATATSRHPARFNAVIAWRCGGLAPWLFEIGNAMQR